MSIMDLLNSPRGVELLQDLLDAAVNTLGAWDDGCGYSKEFEGLSAAVNGCQSEIESNRAIDRYKTADGTPAEIKHRWTPK